MQALENLAAPHQGQGIANAKRNQRMGRQHGKLQREPRKIPEHDAVDAIPLEREENAQDHRGVPKETGGRGEREAPLAEEKAPEALEQSGGDDDQEQPLAELGGEFLLGSGEARGDPSNHPRRRGGDGAHPAAPRQDDDGSGGRADLRTSVARCR